MVIHVGGIGVGRERASNRRSHGRKRHCDRYTAAYQGLFFILVEIE